MTVGAHEVPVLANSGPVQRIAGAQLQVGMQIEPALAATFASAAVPRDPECLKPTTRHLDEILLQRRDPEGEFDFVIVKRAVRSVGPHHELAVAPEQARRYRAI